MNVTIPCDWFGQRIYNSTRLGNSVRLLGRCKRLGPIHSQVLRTCFAVIPGSEIAFAHSADQEEATLDVIRVVQDAGKHSLGQTCGAVNLAVKASTEVERKNVPYDGGFDMPAGKFPLKFVVRESQTGRTGSFKTDVTIPDLKPGFYTCQVSFNDDAAGRFLFPRVALLVRK
jgi:hypothetical protein